MMDDYTRVRDTKKTIVFIYKTNMKKAILLFMLIGVAIKSIAAPYMHGEQQDSLKVAKSNKVVIRAKSSKMKLGDVNGDGKISILDATFLVSHLKGETPEGFVEAAADTNGDKSITINDAVLIVNWILNGLTDGVSVNIDPWENDGEDNGGTAE